MKILVDASFHTGLRVGIARYIERLIPELTRLCETTVLTSVPDIFADMGCQVIPIPKWTRTYRGRILWQLTHLHLYCHRRFDLLLCMTPIAPPLCPIPIISVLHDLTPLAKHKHHSAKNKSAFLLSIKTLRSADAIVTDSLYTKNDLLRRRLIVHSNIKVVHLGPGVEPMEQDSGYALQFQPYLLYVGGFIPTKNVPRLIAAFSQIKTDPQLKLVLVGWGKTEHIELNRRLINHFGLQKRVVLLPEIEDRNLSSLYSNCRAFVFPSLYEGFGLPVLEALAHGAPVTCSYTSSIPEIAANCALYFNPVSVKSIKQALEIIVEHKPFAYQLSILGKQRASCFSWRNTATEIFNLAKMLISR